MRHGRCEHPKCEGHFAKFENCLSEALYCFGEFEDTAGEVDYGVVTHLIIEHGGFALPHEVNGLSFDLIVAGPLYAVMTCDDQGFVDLSGFDTEALARDAFDAYTIDYAEWLEARESVGA